MNRHIAIESLSLMAATTLKHVSVMLLFAFVVCGEPAKSFGPEILDTLHITSAQEAEIQSGLSPFVAALTAAREEHRVAGFALASLRAAPEVTDERLREAADALGRAAGNMQFAHVRWERKQRSILGTVLTAEQQRGVIRQGIRPERLIEIILKRSRPVAGDDQRPAPNATRKEGGR